MMDSLCSSVKDQRMKSVIKSLPNINFNTFLFTKKMSTQVRVWFFKIVVRDKSTRIISSQIKQGIKHEFQETP